MHYYDEQHFVHEAVMKNQITVVHIATKVLRDNGLKNVAGIQEVAGCYIYPAEYFCPINVTTGRIHVEKHSYYTPLCRNMGGQEVLAEGVCETSSAGIMGVGFD